MAPLSLLTVHLDVRFMILEQLLVSEEHIKPRFSNSSTNSTTPSLTILSMTCKQLREEARAVFFGRNTFLFQLAGGRFNSRGPAALSPLFFTGFGGSETKKLMQKVATELIPENGWYPLKYWSGTGANYMLDDQAFYQRDLLDALKSLTLLPSLKDLQLFINFPSSVTLCKYHFDKFSSMHTPVCSSHINTHRGNKECRNDNRGGRGNPPHRPPKQRLLLGKAVTLVGDFRSKTNVKLEWHVFEWGPPQEEEDYKAYREQYREGEEQRYDWGSLSFLRDFFEKIDDGYKTEERQTWLNISGDSQIR